MTGVGKGSATPGVALQQRFPGFASTGERLRGPALLLGLHLVLATAGLALATVGAAQETARGAQETVGAAREIPDAAQETAGTARAMADGVRPTAGLLRGTVFDDQTDRPVAGADVYLVGGEGRRAEQTDEGGRFSFVLAGAGTYRVQAVRMGYEDGESPEVRVGEGETVEITVRLVPAPLLLDSILVSVRRAQREARTGEQLIEGHLRDEDTGAPVATGVVRLVDRRGSAVAVVLADDEGRFRIVSPRPGTYRLQAERIGYEAAESGNLPLMPGDSITVDFRLSPRAVVLEPLTVTASARPWWNRTDAVVMDDFYERWARFAHVGFGEFMTRDSIAGWEGRVLTTGHMLRLNVLAVKAVTGDGGVILRGGCRPVYFVNGARVPPVPQLYPVDLEAVEVYVRPNVPPDMNQGAFPCGAVAYWTRVSPDPHPSRRTLWTALGAAVVGALSFLLLE